MEEHPSSLNVYHGINYFDPLIADEDCPLKVSDETNWSYSWRSIEIRILVAWMKGQEAIYEGTTEE